MAEEKKNEFGDKVVAEAKKLLGTKNDDSGKAITATDFINKVFKVAGADLQGTKVDEQYLYAGRNGGTLFDTVSAAIAGDIVFYKEKTTETTAENCGVTNAAIYTENNKIIRVDKEAGVKEDYLEYEKGIKFILCRFGNKIELPKDVEKQTLPKKADGKTNQRDGGFEVRPAGKDTIHITKLPKKKTYCEPIYPDYVCVSDTVPAWALSDALVNINNVSNSVLPSDAGGTQASEVAPNGKHYLEEEIKSLMEKNPNLTREKAIELLSKDKKYSTSSDENKQEDNNTTSPGDKEDKDHSHGKAPNGKYYSNNDWNYLKNLSLSDAQIKAALDITEAYSK